MSRYKTTFKNIFTMYKEAYKKAVANNLETDLFDYVFTTPLSLEDVKVDDEGVEHIYDYIVNFNWSEVVTKFGNIPLELSMMDLYLDTYYSAIDTFNNNPTASSWASVKAFFNTTTGLLQHIINYYCTSLIPKWTHYFETMNTYFNPLYNVDGVEVLVDDIADLKTTTDIAELTTRLTSAQKTTTVTEPTSVTDEHKESAYDSNSTDYLNKTKDIHTVEGSTTTTDSPYVDTNTTDRHIDTITVDSHIDTHTNTRKGNIGVTMSTALLFDYRKFSNFNICDVIARDIIKMVGDGFYEY